MSVYIPGIEMPTSCSECAFCGYYGNGEHMCDIIQKAVEYESAKMSRLDDCPLVPVPEHGDLIDRDPFIEFIKTHWDSYDQWFVEQLEARPTIIPADKEGEG